MANFTALIPNDLAETANGALEAQGFGPGNFAMAVTETEGEPATWMGLHSWHNPTFQAALVALQSTYPEIIITEASDGKPNFDAVVAALGWSLVANETVEL